MTKPSLRQTILQNKSKLGAKLADSPELSHLNHLIKIVEADTKSSLSEDDLMLYASDPVLARACAQKNKPNQKSDQIVKDVLADKTANNQFDAQFLKQMQNTSFDQLFKQSETTSQEQKLDQMEQRFAGLENDVKERENTLGHVSTLVSMYESIQKTVANKMKLSAEKAQIYADLEDLITNFIRSGKLPPSFEFAYQAKQKNAMQPSSSLTTDIESDAADQINDNNGVKATTSKDAQTPNELRFRGNHASRLSESTNVSESSSNTPRDNTKKTLRFEDKEDELSRFKTRWTAEYGTVATALNQQARGEQIDSADVIEKKILGSQCLARFPKAQAAIRYFYLACRLIMRLTIHLGIVAGIYFVLVALTTLARDFLTYHLSAAVAGTAGATPAIMAVAVIMLVVYGAILVGTTVYFCWQLHKKVKAGTDTRYNWIGVVGLSVILMGSFLITASLAIPSMAAGAASVAGLGTMISFVCLTIGYIIPRGFLQFFVFRYKSLSERISHGGSFWSALGYGLEQIPVGMAMFFGGGDLAAAGKGFTATVKEVGEATKTAINGLEPIQNTPVIVARSAVNMAGEAADELICGNLLVSASTFKRFVKNVKVAFERLNRSVPTNEQASIFRKVASILNWQEMVSDHVEIGGGGASVSDRLLKVLDRSAIRIAAYSAIFGIGMPVLGVLAGLANGVVWSSIWVGVVIGAAVYFIYGYLHEKISLIDITESQDISPKNVITKLKDKVSKGLLAPQTVKQNPGIYSQMKRAQVIEQMVMDKFLNDATSYPEDLKPNVDALRAKPKDKTVQDQLMNRVYQRENLRGFSTDVQILLHNIDYIENVDELDGQMIDLFVQAKVVVPKTLSQSWSKLQKDINNQNNRLAFINGLMSLKDSEIPRHKEIEDALKRRKTIARTPEELAAEIEENLLENELNITDGPSALPAQRSVLNDAATKPRESNSGLVEDEVSVALAAERKKKSADAKLPADEKSKLVSKAKNKLDASKTNGKQKLVSAEQVEMSVVNETLNNSKKTPVKAQTPPVTPEDNGGFGEPGHTPKIVKKTSLKRSQSK